jgi:hypothetical protein
MEAKPQRSNRIGYSYGGTAQLTSGSTAAPLTSLIHEFFTVLAFSGGDWYEGEFLKWMRHGKVCRRRRYRRALARRGAASMGGCEHSASQTRGFPRTRRVLGRVGVASQRGHGSAGLQGVYHLAQGGSHDGVFKWDRKADGDLVRISYADGSVYIGAYAKGAREGNGVFHFAMGDVFKGRWVANVREGAGVLTYLHGGHAEGAALTD